jgi:TolB protein
VTHPRNTRKKRRHFYMKTKLLLFSLVSLIVWQNAFSQADVYLKLSTSERRQLELGIAPLQSEGKGGDLTAAQKAMDIIGDDLAFSLYFKIVYPPSLLEGYGLKKGNLDIGAWQMLGAKQVLVPELKPGKQRDLLKLRVFDLSLQRDVFSRELELDGSRAGAHAASDQIIKNLTGENGISTTKIAYSLKIGKNKELMLADYDGGSFRTLTNFNSINISPDWQPGGGSLAFVSFYRNRADVMSLDLATGRTAIISQTEGLNSSPAWSPDGTSLALTLSQDGNAEIYLMSAENRELRRLTNSWAIDCSPSWSPNGRELVFNSDRPGSPQLYIMDNEGANLRRLTYQGGYNTSPCWSPRGDQIAFVSRIDGKFQVCTIDINGENFIQLTSEGDNEDPSWSPDGLHLCFSSSRTGSHQLWRMHWDGSAQQAITQNGGSYMPAWGPVQ